MDVKFRRVSGFSVIELMITVAVAAIFATMALPAMQDLIARNKVSSEVNRLVADLLLARNTAITRSSFVTICRSGDQVGCLTGPSSASRYDSGWMTYTSMFTRSIFNSGAAGNNLLKVGEVAAPQIEIRSVGTAAPSYVTYLPSGRTDPVGAGPIVLTICLNGQSTVRVPGRRLTLSTSGRPALRSMGVGACNV